MAFDISQYPPEVQAFLQQLQQQDQDAGGVAPTPVGAGNAPAGGSQYPAWTPATNPQSPLYTNSGEDIQYRAENDRNMAIGRGQQIGNELDQWTHGQYGRAGAYENALNQAYAPILAGQGGWSPEEFANILQQDRLNSLQMTGDQYNSYFLTPEEQANWSGDPGQVMNRVAEGAAGLSTLQDERTARIRENLAQQRGDINTGLQSQQDAIRGMYRGTQQNLQAILGNQDLTMRGALGNYQQGVRGALGDYASGVRGALDTGDATAWAQIDPLKLALSPEYQQNYNFGARDAQDIVDRAGRSVGQMAQGQRDAIARSAAAQGNTSPMAIAAAQNRAALYGTANAADAMTDARIGAKQLMLNTIQNKENTRLGAEQASQGLRSNLAYNLGGRRVGTEQGLGQTGVGVEQGLGQAGLGTEQYLGGSRLGAEQYTGSQGLGAEQYLGGSNLDYQKYLGGSGLNWEGDIGNTGLATQQYITNNAVGAQQYIDQAQTQRAAAMAQNRQNAENLAQNNWYNRGMGLANFQANAWQNKANTRLGTEQEARGYLSGQQNQANQNVTVGNQQRIGAYGTQQGAMTGATNSAISNYAVPGMGERIAKMFAKGTPGISGPHTALVGEEGPELVVDLMPRHGLGDVSDPWAGLYGDDEVSEPSDYGFSKPDPSSFSYDPNPATAENLQREGMMNNPTPYQPVSNWRKGLGAVAGIAAHNPKLAQMIAQPKKDPLYESIMGQQSQPNAQPANTNMYRDGSGGGLTKRLMQVAGIFLADGGVIDNNGYQEQLVDGPTVMELGSEVPQAVVPLTPRPDAKVRPADIPRLRQKYASGGVAGRY